MTPRDTTPPAFTDGGGVTAPKSAVGTLSGVAGSRGAHRAADGDTGELPGGGATSRRVFIRRRGWTGRIPGGWPLLALVGGYPVWWALGIETFAFMLVAVPMLVQLLRRKRLRVPSGFGIWLLLVVWVALSGVMLNVSPDGTLPQQGIGRFIAFAVRGGNYAALTVIMLYVLNLREKEMSRRRTTRLLGVMGVITVIGGYVGVFMPHLGFVSPLQDLLPPAIGDNSFVKRLMTVEVAQVHNILDGVAEPRPSAPYEYTNDWGQNTAILLLWVLLGWVVQGRGLRRLGALLLVFAATLPIVQSLNRGLWIAIGISVLYLSVRLAWRGRFGPLAAVFAATGLFAILVIATPLGTLITERIENGHSNQIRSTLNDAAIRAAGTSPVLGYGGNRTLIGSTRSIAIGKSPDCELCGNFDIGSDGQLWHMLIAQGFVGVALYNLFFLWTLWRYRHDHSPLGLVSSLVVLLLLFFQFIYSSFNAPLCWGLIAVALLARNERERRRLALDERMGT